MYGAREQHRSLLLRTQNHDAMNGYAPAFSSLKHNQPRRYSLNHTEIKHNRTVTPVPYRNTKNRFYRLFIHNLSMCCVLKP
ncbi:hypothetical protein Dda3937_04559 [Dickeya dadantii 3937]|uniref:Uncharacterized protein n=1 Tax=Dickeya dadantii (strain 3937) TaxID=198628 RepID=E0SMU6_DICD3|nr:hypothetical protein Dda3937_04559 [Dickeya dadantii 3937]